MDYYDPVAVVDGDAAVVERYAYTAFGVASILAADYSARSSSQFAWNFLFHGQFEDAETGWQNYGFRFYMPELGKWPNRDPIGEAGGLNLYGYVGSDPVNFWDPNGLNPVLNEDGSPKTGGGVNISLHTQGVNRNPASNPNLAYKDDSTFTMMGHGSFGSGNPWMLDQRRAINQPIFHDSDWVTRNFPGKYGSKKLTPKQVAELIRTDPDWEPGKSIVLYACETGKGGDDSFAKKLAKILKTTVWAPTDILNLNLEHGFMEIINGGTWGMFQP